MTTCKPALPTTAGALPARSGLGLKPEHFRTILDTAPNLGFFEIHAENYMIDGGPFHHYLTEIRSRYPLSIHGVGLSIDWRYCCDATNRSPFPNTWRVRAMAAPSSTTSCPCRIARKR